jgi:hypothetical protein
MIWKVLTLVALLIAGVAVGGDGYFLANPLHGPQGKAGLQGVTGAAGPQGLVGPAGPAGPSVTGAFSMNGAQCIEAVQITSASGTFCYVVKPLQVAP